MVDRALRRQYGSGSAGNEDPPDLLCTVTMVERSSWMQMSIDREGEAEPTRRNEDWPGAPPYAHSARSPAPASIRTRKAARVPVRSGSGRTLKHCSISSVPTPCPASIKQDPLWRIVLSQQLLQC